MTTLQPGEVVLNGKYRIEALIGAGAFGEVYRATHLALQAPRALKILRRDAPGVGSTEFADYAQRFQLEAQLGAQLNNQPHIIQVHDFERDGEMLILVMEYASGGSLADRIDRARKSGQPIPIDEVIRIALEVADGLAAIHALDVVHRDLKPSNILCDSQSHAKIADLGLAQVPGGPSMRSRLSQSAPHPGTPAYMSPEQINTSEHLSPASDIYALGAVLFEALTGRLVKNVRPGTPVNSLRDEVPLWLNDLLVRMLADNPRERPWDGAETVAALRAGGAEANRQQAERQREVEQARRAAEDKARREAEERARVAQAEAAARKQLEERQRAAQLAKQAAEEKAQREADDTAKRELEDHQRQAAEREVQGEVERRAREEQQREAARITAERTRLAEAGRARQAQQKNKVAKTWPWLFIASAIVVVAFIIVLASNNRNVPTNSVIRPTQVAATVVPVVHTPVATSAPQVAATVAPVVELHTTAPAQPAIVHPQVSDTDGMTLLYVPAGEFTMGAADSTQGTRAELPQHKVYLDAFWIDQTDVTNAMFGLFVEATGYKTDADKQGSGYVYSPFKGWFDTKGANWQHPRGPSSNLNGLDNHPVVLVSWDDAMTYCQWAGRRLPSEAEWEKAARGTDGRIYPWGNAAPDASRLNFDMSVGKTTEVGKYPTGASPYGALDMTGNVWQWVQDWYDENYYAYSPARNPTGPASGSGRVLRGGSWGSGASNVSVYSRVHTLPDFNYGFRCAKSAQ